MQKNAKLDSNYFQEILANIEIANNYVNSNEVEIGIELLNESLDIIHSKYDNKLMRLS